MNSMFTDYCHLKCSQFVDIVPFYAFGQRNIIQDISCVLMCLSSNMSHLIFQQIVMLFTFQAGLSWPVWDEGTVIFWSTPDWKEWHTVNRQSNRCFLEILLNHMHTFRHRRPTYIHVEGWINSYRRFRKYVCVRACVYIFQNITYFLYYNVTSVKFHLSCFSVNFCLSTCMANPENF